MKLQIINDSGIYKIGMDNGDVIDNIQSINIDISPNGITAHFSVVGLEMITPDQFEAIKKEKGWSPFKGV